MLKKRINKKAQTWSLDLIIGIVVFLLLIVIVYSLLATVPEDQVRLRQDADKANARFNRGVAQENSLPAIFDGDEINETELIALFNDNSRYEEFKSNLGIESEICIVLVDELGGIVELDDGSGGTVNSFGNGDVNISKGPPNIICGG